jgi:glucokinase
MARQLIPLLKCPLFSLDAIKEVLFVRLGVGDRDFNRQLGRASFEIILAIIRDCDPEATVMLDAWFGSSAFRDLEGQLERSGIGRVAEVWCHAPGQVLAERYNRRVGERHQGHPGKAYIKELIEVAAAAAPLGLGPVLSVDTSGPE